MQGILTLERQFVRYLKFFAVPQRILLGMFVRGVFSAVPLRKSVVYAIFSGVIISITLISIPKMF